MSRLDLDRWAEAARRGLVEVGETMGLDIALAGVTDEAPQGVGGSYISLASPDNAIQVGIVSTYSGCRRIAGTLLGLESEEAAGLSDADVADGVGELANVLAGMLKTYVEDADVRLQVGLPMFLVGEVRPGNHVSMRRIEWKLGQAQCAAVLYLHRSAVNLAKAV